MPDEEGTTTVVILFEMPADAEAFVADAMRHRSVHCPRVVAPIELAYIEDGRWHE